MLILNNKKKIFLIKNVFEKIKAKKEVKPCKVASSYTYLYEEQPPKKDKIKSKFHKKYFLFINE